jgi:hypothetical protein
MILVNAVFTALAMLSVARIPQRTNARTRPKAVPNTIRSVRGAPGVAGEADPTSEGGAVDMALLRASVALHATCGVRRNGTRMSRCVKGHI